jgi:hypothetical protein
LSAGYGAVGRTSTDLDDDPSLIRVAVIDREWLRQHPTWRVTIH